MKNLNKFEEIDDLLKEIEQATNIDIKGIDTLCNEVDLALENYNQKIISLSENKKRQIAPDSSDSHVLNLFSMDKNFKVRILSMCNHNAPINSMKRLIEDGNDYTRLVIANNPSATSEILDRIAELTDEQEVLNAVKLHPNVSSVTKYKIKNLS